MINPEEMVDGVYVKGILVEYRKTSPPFCPPASPLNQ